jgi:acyl dehydratase
MYLEDLDVGMRFATATLTVSELEIIAFSQQFDPQPFHTDPVAATASVFGQLVASGWHTAALTMRLIVTSGMKMTGGNVGLGVEQIQWPRPVLPGDTLQAVSEILALRPSQSRTDRGTAQVRTTTTNQHGEVVLTMVSTMLVPRRPAA